MKKPGEDGDLDPNSGVAVHVPWSAIAEECERVEDYYLGGWNDCTLDQLASFNNPKPFWHYWFTKRKPANDNGRKS